MLPVKSITVPLLITVKQWEAPISLKLNSSGGGSITLQEPSTASDRTLTLPDNTGNLISSADSGTVSQTMLAAGVAGNGPAFSAYNSAATTVNNGTWTKIAFQTEEFDTNNNFDSSTNYRFTPTIAGYYQVDGAVQFTSTVSTAVARTGIWKNGAAFKYGVQSHASATKLISTVVSALIYMNGSTDYIELYGYQDTGLSQTTQNSPDSTYFQAALVRAA